MRVGVLAPETSWHFRDLSRASESFDGKIELLSVDFANLATVVGFGQAERFLDGSKSIEALDALIVRTMPYGSLQQVIFRMHVLHRLADSGVRIINPPRSVEIAIDKYLSLSLMAAEGIAVPRFVVCQTVEKGLEAFEQLGGDVVLKPIFGSMGKDVHRLDASGNAESLMHEFVQKGEVLYLQEFVNHGGSDIRILVVGSEIYSMRRTSSDGGWLTNVARGGIAEHYAPTPLEIQFARMAASVNRCRIAGVDLVYPLGSAEPLVLEVNASPGWEAIQGVCHQDVAAEILRFVQCRP